MEHPNLIAFEGLKVPLPDWKFMKNGYRRLSSLVMFVSTEHCSHANIVIPHLAHIRRLACGVSPYPVGGATHFSTLSEVAEAEHQRDSGSKPGLLMLLQKHPVPNIALRASSCAARHPWSYTLGIFVRWADMTVSNRSSNVKAEDVNKASSSSTVFTEEPKS
jgi:hypothetical protein